jgi:uncharacterized membrane protein YeaQ/YmgE (transglycosylase-associated protein family)
VWALRRVVTIRSRDSSGPGRADIEVAQATNWTPRSYAAGMLVLAIILFGMLVGAGAQLILGRSHGKIDWTMAIAAGLVGSFIGGLLTSLLSGDGLDLKPSGIIGSLAGAIVITASLRWWEGRNKPTAADRAAKRSGDPRKSGPR